MNGGEALKVKPAGSYSIGGENEIHIDGSDGRLFGVYFFSVRSNTDVIYELLKQHLSLRQAATVANFDRD